MLQATKAIY
jgi:2-oxoisovalerate dehydrogenase E1 component beta subunit